MAAASRRAPVLALAALVAAGAACAAPLAGAAPAKPGPVAVSGTIVGGKGLTLLALQRDGSATRVRLPATGRFSLRLARSTARGTTLQLLRVDGRYLGPVVLRAAKGRAYTGLAGTDVAIGRIALRGGFARALSAPPAIAVDPATWAKASAAGKPTGAGRLGLLPGARAAELVAQIAAVGGMGNGSGNGNGEPSVPTGIDSDRDGLPNAIDADDDGDRRLDSVDQSTPGASGAGLFTTLFLGFAEALNVNAAGVTPAQIDAVISGANVFNAIMFMDLGREPGLTVRSAHVDCGALRYCRRGNGTAIVSGTVESTGPRDIPWTSYSPDGSGFPNLERLPADRGGAFTIGIQPRVPTADIHPGDTLDVIFQTNRGPVHRPTVLSAFFVTTPAVATLGSAGAASPVTYPVPAGAPGNGSGNPLAL